MPTEAAHQPVAAAGQSAASAVVGSVSVPSRTSPLGYHEVVADHDGDEEEEPKDSPSEEPSEFGAALRHADQARSCAPVDAPILHLFTSVGLPRGPPALRS